jgi:Tol biopolymer transport system component
MTRITLSILTFLMAAVLVVHAQVSPEALLKGAMQREQIDGDDTGAMAQYRSIVDKYPANHAVAAQALLQLAGLYERRGQHDDARQALQRIVADHATGGGAAVVTARTRLTAMQANAAGPFKMTNLDPWLKDAEGISASPDGKYVAYVRGSAIYRRDVVTGAEKALVNYKSGEGPFGAFNWAPDGQHAAFSVSMSDGGAIERRIVTIATGEIRILGSTTSRQGAAFRWSPDSRRVAVTRKVEGSPFEIHVFTVGNTEDINAGQLFVKDGVAGFPGLAWSPDSSRVAFPSPGTGGTEAIRVVTLATKAATLLPIAPAAIGQTTIQHWTKNGEISYTQGVDGGNDIFLINAAGGAARRICEGRANAGGDGCQALSPDGALQVVRKNHEGGGRLMFRSTVTGAERTLTPEAVWEQSSLGFSRDGRLFAFRSNRDGRYAFYVAPVDQTPVANPVQVTPIESELTSVTGTWTANGLAIRLEDARTDVYRIDIDPRTHRPMSAPIRLTQDSPMNPQASVSPDGRRIVYLARGKQIGIAMMDANGARERVVKEIGPGDWSRMEIIGWQSAEEVVVWAAGRDGQKFAAPKTLGVFNVSTGDLRYQSSPVDTPGFTFVPGPRLLFYPSRSADGHLVVRPLDGGPERTIAMPDDWLDYVASPDGKFVAYSITKWAAEPKKPSPSEIRLKSVDTGTERVLLKYADATDGDPGPLAFSPDGKFLAYQDAALKALILNLETGESLPLITNAPAGVDFGYSDVDWSADGSFVVLHGRSIRTTWRAYTGITYDAVTKLVGAKK